MAGLPGKGWQRLAPAVYTKWKWLAILEILGTKPVQGRKQGSFFTILIGAVMVTTTRDLTRATAAWAAVVQMHYFINV